ncbi:MAG: Rieske 2Fe-2S domain-containing protein [Planctomycetaceae bacterium]|nr:Rieske 2Fe-2S domain-containing protein [Planctomycetaceae bacterium]MCA9075059.1 Rieske 2Fe-2S domain-containing protein [Planctomycetaceae bacterium]
MPEFLRIANISDVPPGTGKEVTVGDRVLAVYNIDGTFHVIDGICPHAGGPLGEGALQGCIITCPWHGWQFDVTTGQHCLTPQIRQAQFACRVEGENVMIELPDE